MYNVLQTVQILLKSNPKPFFIGLTILSSSSHQDVEHKFSPFTRNDIEITGEELSGVLPPLHVRRGSEPALNRLSPIPPVSAPPDPTKRWSAAPIIEDQNPALASSTPMKTIVSVDKGDIQGFCSFALFSSSLVHTHTHTHTHWMSSEVLRY